MSRHNEDDVVQPKSHGLDGQETADCILSAKHSNIYISADYMRMQSNLTNKLIFELLADDANVALDTLLKASLDLGHLNHAQAFYLSQ